MADLASLSPTLRSALSTHFSLGEMDSICAELGIDPESIPYREQGKEIRANWLVIYLQKQNQLGRLIGICQRQRPKIVWDKLSVPDLTDDDIAVLEGISKTVVTVKVDAIKAPHSQGFVIGNTGTINQVYGYTPEQVAAIVTNTIAEISQERQPKPYDGRKPYPYSIPPSTSKCFGVNASKCFICVSTQLQSKF